MNITEIRAGIQREIADLDQRIESDKRECRAILDNAEANGRNNLTPAEDTRAEALMRSADAAAAARRRKNAALADARKVEADETEQERRLLSVRDSGAPRQNRTATFSVGRNERVYREDTDPNGRQFLTDIAADFLNGGRDRSGASERIARHVEEERVERPQYAERALSGAGTPAFTGLVVPQYLVDMVAPSIANLRPLADISNRHQLPAEGMSLNISRITTASTAALQTAEFQTVSGTDMDDTLLTVPVQTAAGSQLLSRQAVDRGSGIEDVTVEDLLRQVNTQLDFQIINQATTGILATAQSTTYTDAAPTAAALWPVLYKAESLLEKAVLGVARVDYAVMRTDRFNWLAGQVGTTFPFMGASGTGVPPYQGGLQLTNDYNSPVRAVLSNGLRVVCDNNIPQNIAGGQDTVFLLASRELHVWEDASAPYMIRAEQPSAGSLGVLLVAFSYFAFTAGRYVNNPGKINGTGMLAPVGY